MPANHKCLIYLRASSKEQDAGRFRSSLIQFATENGLDYEVFEENISGTKLDRPELERLLEAASDGDILLVESVDRLSRLAQKDFETLKAKINLKGLKLVVHDLPTTHMALDDTGNITNKLLAPINNLLIDLLATIARLDNEKRIERIKQGQARVGYKATGKKPNAALHGKIKRYLDAGTHTKKDIAKICECGVATVYRVAESLAA